MSSRRGVLRRVVTGTAVVVVSGVTAAAAPVWAVRPSTTGARASTPPTTVLGDSPAAGPFYRPPHPLPPGRPGDIIRSEPLANAPAGSRGWRVLYHSTGLHGEDIAVSGMVFAPIASATSASDSRPRPIVSWAHPTTGVADTCAPSVLPDGPSLIAGLQGFLDAGYVVAATDYQGLGTPGLHPYLVGVSEGRGTLDAARAARHLRDAGAGRRVFLWGHSQGGQGALFAGQLARRYAPELRIDGVAAAAPAAELAAVFDLDVNTVDGVALGGWAVNAYYRTYRASHPTMRLGQVLTAKGIRALPGLVPLCDVIPAQYDRLGEIVLPLLGAFFSTDAPGKVPPWNRLLAENRPGATSTPAPLFIAQDSADDVVPATTTDALVRDLCAKGEKVDYKVYPGLSHAVIGDAAAPEALAWMERIRAGAPAPDTCG